MDNQCRIGKNGMDLIKRFEGLSLEPYRCSAGVLTIGYGSTGPHVKLGQTITRAQAEMLLKLDLLRFEAAIARLVTVPLNQNQADALVSFAFNVGIGALEKSTLLKKLNDGDYNAVPSQLQRWNKAGGKVLPGLVRRRLAEGELFARPI